MNRENWQLIPRAPGFDISGFSFGNKRKTLGALDRLDAEVDIEIGPVKMSRSCLLYIEDFPDRCVLEERELRVGHE